MKCKEDINSNSEYLIIVGAILSNAVQQYYDNTRSKQVNAMRMFLGNV